MTETPKRRRRWPYAVALLLLIVLCGPFAWRYRPLNGTERRLVGAWGRPVADRPAQVAAKSSKKIHFFKSDRTYVTGLETQLSDPAGRTKVIRERIARGHWSCAGSVLTLVPDSLPETDWSAPAEHLFELAFGGPEPERLSLQFDQAGVIHIDKVQFTSRQN